MATTPYPFVAATVLTASKLNSTFNIPTTTKTASHTLVAADAGTRLLINSASATIVTVNTSIFAASDIVEIQNIGAGVCTITAGSCSVSTTGTLALVQNAGGRLVFTAASTSIFQATGVAATAGAFTAKAYCYFNGTGTPAINSSANISSITDNGVGDYTFNFTTAIGSANYFFTGMGGKAGGGVSAANSSFPMIESPTFATSASLRILYINANGSAIDGESQTIGVFV